MATQYTIHHHGWAGWAVHAPNGEIVASGISDSDTADTIAEAFEPTGPLLEYTEGDMEAAREEAADEAERHVMETILAELRVDTASSPRAWTLDQVRDAAKAIELEMYERALGSLVDRILEEDTPEFLGATTEEMLTEATRRIREHYERRA